MSEDLKVSMQCIKVVSLANRV